MFLFVVIALWMTGPVVGAIIGVLIGLRPAVNVAVVLTATALSLVVDAGFIEQIDAWATAVHPCALFGVIVGADALAWPGRRWSQRAGAQGRGSGR